VLDWIANHSSDRHPWFVESRASRSNARRDWYVWRDPVPDGGPPNDWQSEFKAVGSAWTLDAASGQYYLHSFMREQPDLDWDNPDVEAAMHDVLRFWLDRGVDGFRLDAIARIAKDPLLRDNRGARRRRDKDWETIHDRLRGIRRVVDAYDDRMIVGEVGLPDVHRVVSYLNSGDQLHLAHYLAFLDLPWDAEAFRTLIDDFEAFAEVTTWPAWFLENHDHARVASRFDDAGLGPARARTVALMLYALRGTPFVYQGQELGLPDAEIPPERIVDVDGRDPERAPIPWRAQPSGGWRDPWLPLVRDAEALSVQRQAPDPRSTLNLVRRLAALRRDTPVLETGAQRSLDAGPEILAWLRSDDAARLLCAVNFATTAVPFDAGARGTLLLSTDSDRRGRHVEALAPAEAVIVQL
jgi:alpha-glucosidase